MNFLKLFLRAIVLIPGVVQGTEALFGAKTGEQKKKAAVEIVGAAINIADAVTMKNIAYADAAAGRGLRVSIAGAGGAAHLPGMIAAKTVVPVLGVPIPATALQGLDSLLSIVQMPKGVPVGTLAIGAAGAANAGLLAVQILATTDPELQTRLVAWRAARHVEVLSQSLDDEVPE